MTLPVVLFGKLATHRRARVLREVVAATPTAELPDHAGIALMFGDEFQQVEAADRSAWVEWTRRSGRLLLLLPPFTQTEIADPVDWRVERMAKSPSGGEGLAATLATEVDYRLAGQLQTPAIPGATWQDGTVAFGTYRIHPAAGLFAVTTLPLWSLTTLDATDEATVWISALAELAGRAADAAEAPKLDPLKPDHFGMLVFLMAGDFAHRGAALDALGRSSIFAWEREHAKRLLDDLVARGLVHEAQPSPEAQQLIMNSPYAAYVAALREDSHGT